MSKHWEKEDRHCWQKSEVMQNFEKTVLANYSALEAAQLKLAKLDLPKATKEMTDLGTASKGAASAAGELSKALTGSADDGEVMENCAICHAEDGAHDQSCEYSEDEVATAKASVLSELQKMASDAIAVRDMALAYQIERTIQEMLETEDNDQ
jgi:uncharacterized membrane protein